MHAGVILDIIVAKYKISCGANIQGEILKTQWTEESPESDSRYLF